MLISVIVPCYNQKEKLRSLISSLEKQVLPRSDFEVIVSDDGSTDGSVDLLQNYHGSLNLVPIIARGNAGRARTRNAALSRIKGEYVLFLDGDMTADPALLERHLHHLRLSEKTVCIGKVLPIAGQQKDLLSWYRVSRGAQKLPAGTPLPPRYFTTNNSSMPFDLLKGAVPFNEDYKAWGGEDQELGYRLARCGARFVFIEKALSSHDHAESLPEYLHKINHYGRTGLNLLLRNCPEHADCGVMRFFLSRNPVTRTALNLFFSKPVYWVCLGLAGKMPSKTAAFRLFDYLTYCNIFHALKERAHA